MYFFEKAKNEIAKSINQAFKKELVKPSDLVIPVNPDFGDLSLSCFIAGKAIGKTPIEAAGFLVGKIRAQGVIAGTKAIGPYINFTFNKNKISQDVLNGIFKMKNKYGANQAGKNKKVMIEYSNANTHKEYHIGHLRNICFGDAVNRILAANGFKNLSVSYINDFGIHVAKTIWWTWHKDNEKSQMLADKNLDKGYFLGEMYVRACEEIKARDGAKDEVSAVMKKIEKRKGMEYKLWQKTRIWSIAQFAKIYKELGINFEHIFYESEYIDKGKDIVANLYAKRIFEKSQGAVIANLEKYNLGVLMILRSDGTALYPVADLALALEKFKKYKLDKSIYVVDIRQELYFKQLFKVLELLGIKKEMTHLVYDFVKLPSGMMSSRTGNVITFEELKSALFAKAKLETASRHEDWNENKINKISEKITFGAIKFEMLKVSASQVITFDINQALRFDGFTAAYLQYTCARINSIIIKSQSTKYIAQNKQLKDDNLSEDEANKKEHSLILTLSKFPETVVKAGKEFDPSAIAKYLFDLARDFNDYYHSVPVLQTKLKSKEARLKLITAVKQVISNGLDLLGIEVLEEM